MDPALASPLAQYGALGLLVVFLYLRLLRADKQCDDKDAELKEARGLLFALSNETVKTMTALEKRQAQIESRQL